MAMMVNVEEKLIRSCGTDYGHIKKSYPDMVCHFQYQCQVQLLGQSTQEVFESHPLGCPRHVLVSYDGLYSLLEGNAN